MKKTPHPCAPLVIAWANGEVIEWLEESTGEWHECDKHTPPDWNSNVTYRIKPEPSERSYPKSSLTYHDLCALVSMAHAEKDKTGTGEGVMTILARMAADAGIKRYIQDIEEGDV